MGWGPSAVWPIAPPEPVNLKLTKTRDPASRKHVFFSEICVIQFISQYHAAVSFSCLCNNKIQCIDLLHAAGLGAQAFDEWNIMAVLESHTSLPIAQVNRLNEVKTTKYVSFCLFTHTHSLGLVLYHRLHNDDICTYVPVPYFN